MLEIPNTGVVLIVPPNALPEDLEQCVIQMRIISQRLEEDQEASFSSNSSAVVELLPDNLMLQRPVKLMLPHCLVLQETKDCTARIFVSHHGKGCPPHWEEQTHLSYSLEDTACNILLDSFCWVKYTINDKIVTAKKLVVYAAAKQLLPEDEVAVIEVGYYPDLPVEDKFLQRNPDFIVAHKKTFFYRRRKKYPLRLTLDKIFPSGWHCSPEDWLQKEIPFETIALSKEHSFVYRLQKEIKSAGSPLCIFTASQEKGQIPSHLAVYPQTDCQSASAMEMNLSQCQAFLQTEATITAKGGTFEIPKTDVVLEVPPDALPAEMDQCVIHMRIIPRRVMQDEVTSFSSNSSVAVEFFSDDVNLQCPLKLKLPHCLELHNSSERKVTIYTRHYRKERQSHWKKQKNVSYRLEDTACIIWMNRLCCVKYVVNDEIVIGKKIMLYTASRKDIRKNGIAEVEVGYYPDMPGGGELLQLNPNLVVDYRKILYYKETQRLPLQVSLNSIVPLEWECSFPDENPQEIPFRLIAWSVEHSHLYILQKMDRKAGDPVCKFTATQEKGDLPIELVVQACRQNIKVVTPSECEGTEKPLDEALLDCFMILKKNLAATWRDAGRYLKVPEGTLAHIRQQYSHDLEEGIYQMLLSWHHRMGSLATPSKLFEALQNMGRRDLVEKVKDKIEAKNR